MWSRNKATLFFALAGAGKALLDNYWVFTNIPLVGTEGYDDQVTAKIFYMLAQMVVTGAEYGGVGFVIDRVRGRPSAAAVSLTSDVERGDEDYQAMHTPRL